MVKRNKIDSVVLIKKWQEIFQKHLPKSLPERTSDPMANMDNRCIPVSNATIEAGIEYRKWKQNYLKKLQT